MLSYLYRYKIIMDNANFYLNSIWSQTNDYIANSGQIAETVLPYFESKLVSINNDEAVVVVPKFINYCIMNDNIKVIENCLQEVYGKKIAVRLTQQDEEVVNVVEENDNDSYKFIFSSLDPNMTFTNFVVGKSNAQAHLASMTCASNIGIVYNPLFIYGNSGMGKTHLLNAIGNHTKSLFPDKKIGFITDEGFAQGVDKANHENGYENLKAAFYDLDLLLVDDVQFLSERPKFQEIFFHVFNKLVNDRKQICIAAECSPNEIKGLENRIISRFNQGLTVSIEAPEYETSINILKKKIANSSSLTQLSIDEDVLNFIATNFSQDVRSLEGAVNRLLFYSINFPFEDEKDRISLKLAVEAFKEDIKVSSNELTISTVRKAVCDYYNLTKQQITSANRTKNISNARQIAMYLCRKLLDATFDDIGKEFGGRDHSTVMSSCEAVEKKIKSDPLYLKAINEIETRIKS